MVASDNLSPAQFPIAEHPDDADPGWRKLVAYHKGAPADEENDLEHHEIGLLTYRDRGTHVDIGNRRVHEDYRYQGVATALQDALERRSGKKDIVSEPGLSADAYDFRQAYVAKHPSSRWKVGSP